MRRYSAYLVVTAAVNVGLLPLVAACKRLEPLRGANTAYARVLETKTIRTAYISYPPSFIKDPQSGGYSGIFHEVLTEMARRMDLRVDYVEETAWGTMITAVQSGRADLVCTGIWPNATRGKFVDFTDPVYYSPIHAYVKTGNHALDGRLAAINSAMVTIATIDGEMTSIVARADFPHARTNELPQTTDVSQVLLELVTEKADVTFVEPAIAEAFLQRNPGAIRRVPDVPPVRVFPNVMMVNKGEAELLSMLNTALSELVNTGFVEQAISKYESKPGLFLRQQWPYRQL
jgi:polar amino acid transport system substrate-binding protein